MGVDCDICLPHTARVHDVADVMATLAGAPGSLLPFSTRGGRYFKSDAEISITHYPDSPTLSSCLNIDIRPPKTWSLLGNVPRIDVMWHFDGSVGASDHGLRHEYQGRLLGGRSTPFWIAMGKGLVDFFGGAVDFNDCDLVDIDYQRPDALDLAAHSGDAWEGLQQRMYDVKPLTVDDMVWAEQFAAYKNAGALR